MCTNGHVRFFWCYCCVMWNKMFINITAQIYLVHFALVFPHRNTVFHHIISLYFLYILCLKECFHYSIVGRKLIHKCFPKSLKTFTQKRIFLEISLKWFLSTYCTVSCYKIWKKILRVDPEISACIIGQKLPIHPKRFFGGNFI